MTSGVSPSESLESTSAPLSTSSDTRASLPVFTDASVASTNAAPSCPGACRCEACGKLAEAPAAAKVDGPPAACRALRGASGVAARAGMLM